MCLLKSSAGSLAMTWHLSFALLCFLHRYRSVTGQCCTRLPNCGIVLRTFDTSGKRLLRSAVLVAELVDTTVIIEKSLLE